MTDKPPDVLLVVLDAVRALDTLSGPAGEFALPFLRKFGKNSVTFPRAVAPATWTVPSVASLMTGLYPWNHGVSAIGSGALGASVPTLAGTMRQAGYSTVLLSANAVISHRTNLSSGFERAYWADWWEQFFRIPRTHPPQRSYGTLPSSSASARRHSYAFEALLRRGMRVGLRYPALLQAGNKIAQQVRSSPPGSAFRVCPWIEPTLAKFLSGTPKETPMFAFLHLNDAHEPYYSDNDSAAGSFGESLYLGRQDYMRVIEGLWQPSDSECESLHQLYMNVLKALDTRVQGIIEHFLEARGAQNSLVVVTADHGQAFGEGGWLFHMVTAEEAVLRIPLLVHFPNSEISGVARGWASLVDIAPTILELAKIPPIRVPDGRPILELLDRDRADAVWALGDGLPWRHLEGIVFAPKESTRKELPERSWIASYEGSSKSVYNLRGEKIEIRPVDTPPGESAKQGVIDQAPNPAIQAQVLALCRLLKAQVPPYDGSTALRRLESWGYGV
jgi:arylsulfatase A-like enzyme